MAAEEVLVFRGGLPSSQLKEALGVGGQMRPDKEEDSELAARAEWKP